MPRPSSPLPIETPPIATAVAPERATAGIWTIDGDSLVTVERFDVGPAVVLVPTEEVLLLSVELPIPNPRRRLAALPFAVEDRIAERLVDVHVALGSELGPNLYLAGIVTRETMGRWAALLDGLGLARAMLVPDALGLPVPPVGSWSVDLAGERMLVRAGDGTGFALPLGHFHASWTAAGRPRLRSYGEALPADYAAEPADYEVDSLAARLASPALDLRQGDFARPREAVSPLWKRIAWVAAAGALAHTAIAAADTLALDHIADEKAAETRSLVQQVAPSATIGSDLAQSVADILPASGPGPSSFLPLFGRIAAALQPLGAGVKMRSISYDGAAGTMTVELEAPNLAGVQQAGAALSGAGLSSQPGAAAQSEGKAVGSFLIKGAA